jgi:hypothetical protein
MAMAAERQIAHSIFINTAHSAQKTPQHRRDGENPATPQKAQLARSDDASQHSTALIPKPRIPKIGPTLVPETHAMKNKPKGRRGQSDRLGPGGQALGQEPKASQRCCARRAGLIGVGHRKFGGWSRLGGAGDRLDSLFLTRCRGPMVLS